MKREGISFRRAVEILQNDIGLISESHEPVKQSTTKQLASNLVAEKDEQQALKRVIDFYHETLKQSPEALEYLESRGLNHPELINTFKLGFANRTLAYRLPAKNRKAGAEIRGLLQSVGILRKSGHEHFNGSIIVPVVDESEQIKEVYGRKVLGSKLRKGTAQHLYLPGEHQGIWNHLPLAACDEIILCESLIDAMTFWVNNFRNVTCSYGTNGFTEELLNGFIQHKVKRVLIAYDRDEAGNVAAEKLAEQFKQYNIDCYRVQFPKNMDANEYALKMSPARKSLELVIRKAEPMLSAKVRDKTAAELKGVNQKEKKSTSDLVAKPKEETILPASPMPTAPSLEIEAEVSDNEIIMLFGSRRYRVRGLKKTMSYEQLKINLCVSNDELMHVDHLDLYHAKQRLSFIKQASIKLGVNADVIKKDLTKVLWKLEQLQDEQIQKTLKPEVKAIQLSAEEETQALGFITLA